VYITAYKPGSDGKATGGKAGAAGLRAGRAADDFVCIPVDAEPGEKARRRAAETVESVRIIADYNGGG